jgi:hypothetical protein
VSDRHDLVAPRRTPGSNRRKLTCSRTILKNSPTAALPRRSWPSARAPRCRHRFPENVRRVAEQRLDITAAKRGIGILHDFRILDFLHHTLL